MLLGLHGILSIWFAGQCKTFFVIFITFNISVMVSNFGFGRQKVPCYLSECMAFKRYYCHVLVMCSFNTGMKLSSPNPLVKLHFLQNLE